MASIPVYQRRQLASSVVGTAGVDTSGQRIGQSIAQDTNAIGTSALSLEAQRQESKDAALANKTLISMDMNLNEAMSKHQTDYASFRGDKMDRINAFQTQADEIFQNTLENTPSQGARDLLEKHGYSTVKGYIDQEMKNADLNQAKLAFDDTTDSVNLLGQKAESIGRNPGMSMDQKLTEFQKVLNQGTSTYAAAYALLSPENREKLKNGIPESLSKSLLYANFESHPDDTKAMLESGLFDKFIPTEERAKFMHEADVWSKGIADKKKAEAEQAIKTQQDSVSADFAKRLDPTSANPLTLAEVQKAEILGAGKLPGGITKDDAAIYTKAITEPVKEGLPQEKEVALANLSDRFFAIGSSDGKEVNPNASFAQVAEFRQAAIQAHQIKARSDTQYSEDLATSEKAFQKGINDAVTEPHKNGAAVWNYYNKWFGTYYGYQYKDESTGKMVNQPIDKGEITSAKAYLGSQLMSYMAKYDIKSKDVPAVAQSILSKFLIDRHPELAGKTSIPNMIMNAETSFRHLYAGNSTAAPDFMVKPVAKSSKYAIGTLVPQGNKIYKVTGYTPDGKTEVEDVTNGG